MEDAHIGYLGVKEKILEGETEVEVVNPDVALFGVFDGHGGI
jgi:serine/threonine protein phosphatase PrpC